MVQTHNGIEQAHMEHERQEHYDVKWQKLKQARSYSNVTKKCHL